jgi:hypothetical protein
MNLHAIIVLYILYPRCTTAVDQPQESYRSLFFHRTYKGSQYLALKNPSITMFILIVGIMTMTSYLTLWTDTVVS